MEDFGNIEVVKATSTVYDDDDDDIAADLFVC